MTRNGKIARLPRTLRHQLNQRLLDGEPGARLLEWLNALPQVHTILKADFQGRPINPQNLTDWKQGGYRDWLVQQEALALAQRLGQDATQLPSEDRPPFTETLALWLASRYAVVASQLSQSEGDMAWALLREFCADLAKLHRCDLTAERLRLQHEKLDFQRHCLRDKFTAEKSPSSPKVMSAGLAPLEQTALAVQPLATPPVTHHCECQDAPTSVASTPSLQGHSSLIKPDEIPSAHIVTHPKPPLAPAASQPPVAPVSPQKAGLPQTPRSAGFQPAVSPISSRQSVETPSPAVSLNVGRFSPREAEGARLGQSSIRLSPGPFRFRRPVPFVRFCGRDSHPPASTGGTLLLCPAGCSIQPRSLTPFAWLASRDLIRQGHARLNTFDMKLNALCLMAILLAPVAPAQPVHKTAEDFEQMAWVPDQWNKAKGRVSLVAEAAPDVKTAKSLKLDVEFSGEGFEPFTAIPAQPLWIPGDARSVTLRCKVSDSRYAFKVDFLDGWGRDKAAGVALTWDVRPDPSGNWKTATFKVPDTWVRPVQIRGITTHNWEARNVKTTLHIQVDDIEVETEIKDVDPKTGLLATWKPEPNPANPARALKECPSTPLVVVAMDTGEEANIFTRTEPAVKIGLKNWKPGELTGQVAGRLSDGSGNVVQQFEQPVTVASSSAISAQLKPGRFGLYALNVHLTLSDGTDRTEQMTLARLPADKELTEPEKLASPYGLNVHSGSKIVINPFKKAGLIWFREYAFAYDWLLRAKGEDVKYAGWPYYPKIAGAYADAGVKCLPVIQKSVTPPEVAGGKVIGRLGPDRRWTREMASIVMAFPQISHWELSNEYDLPSSNWKAEEMVAWANYRAYHKQFANILDIVGGGELTAVENGRAGLWPERLLRCVQSGDFEKIGVVNVHHYCGTDAPEINVNNFNMGTESRLPSLLFDDLRAVKRAAQAGGKKRQSWLTEFGWDTLAGPVVSPYEQAVFLPRAWMMVMAAGTDKAFWFYNFDAKNPKQFFDGCGLLNAKGEPKLSLCSLAGLTSVLPSPHYVGDLDAGTNTCGYVFEDSGKLVASLWTIHGDEGPTVRFQARQLKDYLGNEITGNAVRLTMAPVYAVGLSKDEVWYKQTAYSLDTPHLIPAAAGDVVHPVVLVTNNRAEALTCRIKLVLPEGWKTETAEVSANLTPGASKSLELPVVIPFSEALGFKEVKVVVSEGQELKQMVVKVLVQSPLTVQVSPMEGRPGKTQVIVTIGNRSTKPLNGALTMRLPGSWKALTPEIAIADLKPQEVRPITCQFEWSADWKPGETAQITVDFGGEKKVTRSLIPSQYALHHAKNIKLDGRLDDWPPETQLPGWLLGSTAGEANATVRLAWAKEGLYGAIEAHDSKLLVKDPRSFWAGDALEIFIDSADNKQPRAASPGDHQFWCMPLPDDHRVYLGQWKMKGEIPATRYDISGVQGAATRTADGYVMEFLIPAGQIQNYHPQTGGRLGLNLNLTIQGRQAQREVYWPSPKNAGATAHPERWGTVLLLE